MWLFKQFRMLTLLLAFLLCMVHAAPPLLPRPVELPASPPPSPKLDILQTAVKAADILSLLRYVPDTENIYYIFTRAEPNTGYPVLLGSTSLLAQTDFKPSRRTVVLVHGWLGSALSPSNLALIPAFLYAEDVNVLVVDWNAGAKPENYYVAVANTVTSGESVARFIAWLNTATGASLSDYHIVGHSLGGHQAGIIGRNLGGQVAYITALDPAYPGWTLNPYTFRPDDGLYTEVIHTNAGNSGYLTPVGHVDFYPNGGIGMPGCDGQNCDHDRCFHYFEESIRSGGFIGTECPTFLNAMFGSCNLPGRLRMGGLVPKTGSRGIYHLTTNAHSPFSID